MKYLIIEKVSNKLYGPPQDRQLAVDALMMQIDVLKRMLADPVVLAEEGEEYKLYVNGELIAIYEIVEEGQVEYND